MTTQTDKRPLGIAPFQKMVRLSPGATRWTDGFWAEKFQLCQDEILPSMWDALQVDENGAVFSNFYVAAGLHEGQHFGTDWSDGDCYKWMEAVSHIYSVTGDAALVEKLDELIDVIAKAQDPGGYICTQVQLTDKQRFEKTIHHELYNIGHLFTSAAVHYRVTGKENFLSVAIKMADYLYDTFRPRPPELANFGWNPSNIMGLVDLYRATGEEKYLELAGVFVDMRGSKPQDGVWHEASGSSDGTDQNQDAVPLREEFEAVGHAVTATYLYCGATDVYAETGDEALFAALEQVWQNLTGRKMYVTGAVGARHHTVSRRGHKVWEAFGLDYELPNASSYNETCADIGNGMWNWRMLAVTGDAKYADVMEQVIYNSGLSGMSIDGREFCYTNPLRWYGENHQHLTHDRPGRWFTHNCYCCPPQVARTIARMQDWAYSLSPEGLWVHLFGGNRVETVLANGEKLVLEQQTDYPWDGTVTLTIEEAGALPFALMIRVPGWAEGATLAINGEVMETSTPGSYARIERSWSAGDVVELVLPIQPRLVLGHPKVEEIVNSAAIMVGPVVYCVEAVDVSEDVAVSDLRLPRNAELSLRYEADLLGGVGVVEGDLLQVSDDGWNGELYRTGEMDEPKATPVRFVPYHTWWNRGDVEMAVWLPLW